MLRLSMRLPLAFLHPPKKLVIDKMIEHYLHMARMSYRVALFFFASLGLFFTFRPILLSRFALMQADPGDTVYMTYIFEHSYRWLLQNPLHSNFWDMPIFYPAKNVSAYSDILFGVVPIYWFFRAMQFLPDTSVQLWMITVALMNFFAAFYFLKKQFRLFSIFMRNWCLFLCF